MDYAKNNGTIKKEKFSVKGESGISNTYERIVGYTPNNPDEHVMVIVDHVLLMKCERGFNKKQNIDKWVEEYCIEFANQFKYTMINIAQLNRGIGDWQRIKNNVKEVEPNCGDISTSSSMEQCSHIVIGIFNPNMFNKIKECFGYQLADWKGSLRIITLMKGRYARAPFRVGVIFDGATNLWEELPSPTDQLLINASKSKLNQLLT